MLALATPAGAGAVAGAGPLTFDQAKAAGTKVDWGPNCDTTTGQGRGAERIRPALRRTLEGR